MFDQVSEYCDVNNLTHKINHHAWDEVHYRSGVKRFSLGSVKGLFQQNLWQKLILQ